MQCSLRYNILHISVLFSLLLVLASLPVGSRQSVCSVPSLHIQRDKEKKIRKHSKQKRKASKENVCGFSLGFQSQSQPRLVSGTFCTWPRQLRDAAAAAAAVPCAGFKLINSTAQLSSELAAAAYRASLPALPRPCLAPASPALPWPAPHIIIALCIYDYLYRKSSN